MRTALVVAGLHLAVIALLVRCFSPDVMRQTAEAAIAAFPLSQPFPPQPRAERHAAGRRLAGSGQPSRQPPDAPAPESPQTITIQPISGGDQDAPTIGAGLDPRGQGKGLGDGSGMAPEKLSGEIKAEDYPTASRSLRIGDYVIVALTIGVDGRVRACTVHRPSRDAAADAITCRLAQERFRFRPARDAAGRLVEAVFGWRQSWHY